MIDCDAEVIDNLSARIRMFLRWPLLTSSIRANTRGRLVVILQLTVFAVQFSSRVTVMTCVLAVGGR